MASFLLENQDHRKLLKKAIQDLGLSLQEKLGNEKPQFYFKGFAEIFQHLYRADYLNRQNSDQVLNYLKKSEFKEGLAFGMKVPVAHKYGEAMGLENSNIHSFNDCGIVFFEKSPYSLCLSLEGFHQQTLIQFAQELSQITYRYMSANKTK